MTQNSLFPELTAASERPAPVLNRDRGELLKERGMAAAASKNTTLVQECREHLVRVAKLRDSRTVTADDAFEFLAATNRAHLAGNWMGSLFRDRRFFFTGNWTKSARPSRHANMIRVWGFR